MAEPQVATRELGNRGVQVPIMGFGSAHFAGRPGADADESVAIAAIQSALAHGINLFDTAPLYGAGRSERMLGKALKGVARDRFVVSTKVGRILDEETDTLTFDFSRDGILRSFESSLRRLQMDRVDFLLIHDPDKFLEQAIDEAYPVLDDLRSQGVIRGVGAGMNWWQPLSRLSAAANFDLFLLAGRYTLLEQRSLDFLADCRQRGIGIYLGGVFNSGILATGAVPHARHNYRPASDEVMARTASIEAVCLRYNVPLSHAALQFAAAHPAVSSLVIGAVSSDEVESNVAGLNTPIPTELWSDLRDAGLLDPGAPVPTPVE